MSIPESCSCNGTSKDKPAHIQPKRTNRVRKIHRSQPFELFVEALEQDGCVVVQDFVNPQIPAQVESAETVSNAETISEDDNRGREQPLDLNSLIRESLLPDTLYQTLSTHFLTLETLSWSSKSLNMSVSKPTLFKSTTQDLNDQFSFNSASSFHRSDTTLHTRHHAATKYDYQSRRDVTLGLLVPELDSLSSTVPIRVIPGSHLWDDQKPEITRGVKEVQLHAGEAMILLGSLYHAVGEETDSERPTMSRSSTGSGNGSVKEKLLHDMWMCSGIYRAADQILVEDDEDE